MQRRTRTTQSTPADQGFAAARAEAQVAPPTRENKIEVATFLKNYKERDAREHIDTALKQLHSMLDDIEREAQRPSNSLEQVIYHIRHEMAWKCANISSTLDNADSALREAIIARTKLDILNAAPEA
jgi:hypothetical protein